MHDQLRWIMKCHHQSQVGCLVVMLVSASYGWAVTRYVDLNSPAPAIAYTSWTTAAKPDNERKQ